MVHYRQKEGISIMARSDGYNTKTRQLILDYLIRNRQHAVSASNILEHLEAEGASPNPTTVYRYLDKLAGEQRVMKYVADKGEKAVFQYVDEGRHCREHLHLKCVRCGRIYHLDCHFMDEVRAHLMAEHGFTLQCEGSVLYGLCRSCAANEAEDGQAAQTCKNCCADVDTDKKQVALSFDAAWGNEQTEQLLEILDKYKVKSTFFLVGDWVKNYPDSVKDIAKHGHDVGNHSNTHPHMTQMSSSDMVGQIQSCNEKIKELTGKTPTLFRAPYGDYNNDVVKSVNGCNMYCVQWDVDSLDWKDPTPEQIKQNIMKKIKNGSIILMHNGAKNTPEALPTVIEAIKSEGYEIVPISQILLKGEYYTDVDGKMCSKTATQPSS